MSTTAKASYEYLKNAVNTATPEQLQLMLLDGAIRFTRRGIEAIESRSIEAAFHALERAQRIVLQLNEGLQREANPELVDQMSSLFTFIYQRLVEASMRRSRQPADDALRILLHQRETWELLIQKLAREVPKATPSATVAIGGANSEAQFSVEG